MRHIAAIDVGSNAIRMVIGVVQRNGHVRPLKAWRAPVRIGKDVFRDGAIRPETASLAAEAFRQFSKELKKNKVTHVRAVATSAVRDASNGALFSSWLALQSGLHLCVINGVEEGRLIHLAISDNYKLKNRRMLVLDIGGGSIELMASKGGILKAAKSFPIGTVRLLNGATKKSGDVDYKSINRNIAKMERSMRQFIRESFGSKPPELFVGTGGNIEALGRLRKRLLHAESERVLTPRELDVLYLAIKALSYKERIKRLELRPDRADVILPAASLLRTVMKVSSAKRVFIPGLGLKDGVLVELAELLKSTGAGKKKTKKKASKKKGTRRRAGQAKPTFPCDCFSAFR